MAICRRYQSLLAALAEGAQHAIGETDLMDAQADQLGNARRCGVEGFEHGPVTQAEWVSIGGGERIFDLLLRHRFRQPRRAAGVRELDVGSTAMWPRPTCQR